MSHTIELKLLKIINTLVICGSVKTTAKILNLSPAAISYSLKKLREITGEHLFIRTRTGMKPNSTAYELSQRYQKHFAADFECDTLDNHQTSTELTILTYSPIEMLLSTSIANLEQKSHHDRYVFLPYTTNASERLDNLINKSAYIDIGSELPQDSAVSKLKLFTSDISILAGINNHDLPDVLTLKDMYQLKHALWSSLGDYYCESMNVSAEVIKYIQEREIAVVSSSIINMVEFCSRSECIMLIPDVFTPLFTRTFPVKSLQLPAELHMKHDCYIHFNNRVSENALMTRSIDAIIRSVKSTIISQSP
ncbi:LysR family transcriptional regulator [Scandinavium sp. M-37]|uniref:LysR family transcriptional regulator n=1 Tax=Scandinavium sp. M-37 TaxID=3373077 RepID=UPI003747667D